MCCVFSVRLNRPPWLVSLSCIPVSNPPAPHEFKRDNPVASTFLASLSLNGNAGRYRASPRQPDPQASSNQDGQKVRDKKRIEDLLRK